MKNYLCLIISHGDLAFELYEVARKFMPLEIPVFTYTNKKDSIETIVQDAGARISDKQPEKVIIFVDLVGGSCWQAALKIKKDHQQTAVIGGVNLPAIVSLATNIERLDWPQILLKIEQDAVKAVKVLQ